MTTVPSMQPQTCGLHPPFPLHLMILNYKLILYQNSIIKADIRFIAADDPQWLSQSSLVLRVSKVPPPAVYLYQDTNRQDCAKTFLQVFQHTSTRYTGCRFNLIGPLVGNYKKKRSLAFWFSRLICSINRPC